MNKNPKNLNFIIDKLTNSIELVETGESLETIVLPITKTDLKVTTTKKDWIFDWEFEFYETNRQVYKLVLKKDLKVIQGLVSFEIKSDHVYMHLVENAPLNKGKNKLYAGVAGNLIAFVCKISFEQGHEGNVSFLSKTQLIEHYEKTLGAFHFGGRIMIIETKAALRLVNQYF
jgi:hypothetical protein